ncbi:hypothetical protein [Actinomadura sp. DC4]|uniref:hypothetical protein n=1 Tax=Actinomadura sp. DC4 TaxID=3055069 RepID=UPI0025B26F27|nr:hypothetical protein [Actinomadura sp. DC4]MDN3352107.1 hypothetical protein [Actinomadura sp. DC4]
MNHRREAESGSPPEAGRGGEETRRAGDRAFGPPPPGPQWPGREPSEAEINGVPATDTEARTPLGVGTSTTRRAEKAAKRERDGVHGRTRRPYGTSEPEDDTGVAPQRPVHPESPRLPTGDQAG